MAFPWARYGEGSGVAFKLANLAGYAKVLAASGALPPQLALCSERVFTSFTGFTGGPFLVPIFGFQDVLSVQKGRSSLSHNSGQVFIQNVSVLSIFPSPPATPEYVFYLPPSVFFRFSSTFDARHSLNRFPLAGSVTTRK